MTELKSRRIEKNLTQQEASRLIGVSLRSYISYENDETKEGTPKYRFLLFELEKINPLDEEHGLLNLETIKTACSQVFAEYPIEFCYLFGSYAKGKASENSDVDLIVEFSRPVTLITIAMVKQFLEELLGRSVDIIHGPLRPTDLLDIDKEIEIYAA